jgi:hypothetical protein
MRVVVVYESMYGNTHQVAEAIANGLADVDDSEVLSLEDAMPGVIQAADLVVVGGPTHVHGMSRESTRNAAVEAADKKPELELDPDAPGPGLREWLASLPRSATKAAAFDTRIDAPALFTGRASKGIARHLRKHGFELIVEPESFLVTKDNILVDGEADRARRWAEAIASKLRTPVQ